MADATDAATAPLSTLATLQPVWDRFRKGDAVGCPADGGPMALAVDSAQSAYRFVCVQCGASSPWFEAKLTHLAIRDRPGRGRDE